MKGRLDGLGALPHELLRACSVVLPLAAAAVLARTFSRRAVSIKAFPSSAASQQVRISPACIPDGGICRGAGSSSSSSSKAAHACVPLPLRSPSQRSQ